jgi:hypothetical protein
MPRPIQLALLSLALVGSLAAPARAADASISVKGWGVLVLPLPDGWRATEKPGDPPILALAPASGHAFEIQLSPIRAADGYMPGTSKESLRKMVSVEASTVKSQAVEKELAIREFQSGDVHGNWFAATDRAPKPGEFRYMASGLVAVKDLPVQFTILYDGNTRASVEPALKMLGAAHKR